MGDQYRSASAASRDVFLHRAPHVRRRQPVRDHLAKIRGNVKERSSAQRRLVAHRYESDAGADADPEDPERTIALLFQPAKRAACVEHRLAIRLNRQPDVRPNEMIAARMARNRAPIMIRQAHLDGRNSKPIQPATNGSAALPSAHSIERAQSRQVRSSSPEKLVRAQYYLQATEIRARWKK